MSVDRSGVAILAVISPLASRFLSDSFFSRCSRMGGPGAGELAAATAAFRARLAAKSGLRGEEMAGAWASSSTRGLFWGIKDGGGPAIEEDTSAIVEANCVVDVGTFRNAAEK